MNCLRNLSLVFISCIILSGCASIVSNTTWPFTVDSDPSGAKISIINKRGAEVYKGRTPATMRLKSGSGFFTKESYTISFTLSGYETKTVKVECRLNEWYFGNIVFGGFIGLLIVDPATGAMFKLNGEGISEQLRPATTSLHILDKNKIPDSWKNHLVALN